MLADLEVDPAGTGVWEGKGSDPKHGEFPCRFKLLDDGTLELGFGDGFSTVYFCSRFEFAEPAKDTEGWFVVYDSDFAGGDAGHEPCLSQAEADALVLQKAPGVPTA